MRALANYNKINITTCMYCEFMIARGSYTHYVG